MWNGDGFSLAIGGRKHVVIGGSRRGRITFVPKRSNV